MEMELLPPFEISQLLPPERKIKCIADFSSDLPFAYCTSSWAFITILRKFIIPGLNLLQKFGGWEREEELILEFRVYTASSKDK